jgi:hypothetical protein
VLRLEAGSTEAGFLSAFCTIEAIPTFVVIHNGQLQEQLTSGISQNDFINRVRKVLGAPPIPGTVQPPSNSQSPPPPPQVPSPAERTPQSTTPTVSPAHISQFAPSAKAKGKQRATELEKKPQAAPASAAQREAREALRKKKQEEKDELDRIKARIEADKAGRRAEAEARKAEREKHPQSPTASQPRSTSTRGSQAEKVHLNVRLFDGRTVRSTFPRTAKLQDDVRRWIDQEFIAQAEQPGQKHPPYLFRQILAPLPSKELTMSEEDQTLGDIDLAPSATLVLIPVKGYIDAYSGDGDGIVGSATGAVTGLVAGVFGLAGSALGFVGSTVSSVLGGGAGTGQQPSESNAAGRSLGDAGPEQTEPSTTNLRVRTLADQRAGEPRSQQFYNGNQASHMRSIRRQR